MPVLDVVSRLSALEPATLSQSETSAALADLGRLRSWCDGLQIALTRRMHEFTPLVEHSLAEITNAGRREADVSVKRAATVEAVPEFGAALSHGAITGAHVDVMGRALGRLDPEQRDLLAGRAGDLLHKAGRSTPEQFEHALRLEVEEIDRSNGVDRFERQRRATSLRMWLDPSSGMHRLAGEFDPERGGVLAGRLQNAVEALFHGHTPSTCPQDAGKNDHLRALALMSLTASPAASTEIVNAGNHIELAIVVDHQTLRDGLHERSLLDCGDGSELPVATLRRMACEAGIIPVVLNGDGVVLDEGRKRRLASRAQRVALRVMYEHCPIPGCSVRSRHCVPHHLAEWTDDLGPTDMENLLPLCAGHHHAVHEGGWQIRMGPDRSLKIVLPDGEILTTGPPEKNVNDARHADSEKVVPARGI